MVATRSTADDGYAVVVGLDNGGTSTTPRCSTRRAFLVDRLVEVPSRVLEGPGAAVEALAAGVRPRARRDRHRRERGPRGRAGHARARPAPTGVISSKGCDQLLRSRSGGASTSAARWRTGSGCPSSTTTTATPRRCTPTTPLRAARAAALVGRRDRRHRSRRRCRRAGPGRQGRGRHGRRVRARAHPDARPARAGTSRCPRATAASSATPRASRP